MKKVFGFKDDKGGGSGSGGGDGSHGGREHSKPKNKVLKPRKAEDFYQDVQQLVINELKGAMPEFDGDLSFQNHSRYTLESTQYLLMVIFRRLAVKQSPSSKQSDGHDRHNTEYDQQNQKGSMITYSDSNQSTVSTLQVNASQPQQITLSDQSTHAQPPGDTQLFTHLSNVDDITFEEQQNIMKVNEYLKAENSRLDSEYQKLLVDFSNARDRIGEVEEEKIRAVSSAVEKERRTARNDRVALKPQLVEEIRGEFRAKIQKLQESVQKGQDTVKFERSNVVAEQSGRSKDQRDHRSSQERLRREHKVEIDDLKSTHERNLQRRLKELNHKLSEDKRQLEETIRQLNEERATILANADHRVNLARDHWEQTNTKLISRHQQDMQELEERLAAELSSETTKLSTTIKQLRDKNKALWEKHDGELDRLKTQHSNELKQLESKVEEQKEALNCERAQLLAEVADMETRVKKEAEETEARREQEYKQKFDEIGKQHENDKVQLRKDRDAYSAALIERDKKTGDKKDFLTDVQVTFKWGKLVKEVKELARLEWKRDPDIEGLLKSISVQPETLKRQLLQDSIWLVLHEFIFCSPFRIFGKEGKRLEAEWYKCCEEEGALLSLSLIQHGRPARFRYSQSPFISLESILMLEKDPASDDNRCYIWPAPEVETERWRFVTVKECRASLGKKPSVLDPRHQLRESYLKAREELRDKLWNMLDKLAILEEKHKDVIEKLTDQAASMWLAFSMQHYRIVMVIKDPKVKSIEDRLIQAQMSSVDLVLVPRLKSYGNSKGQDLKEDQTISSCEGETLSIGTSKSSRGAPSRGQSMSQRD